MRSTEPENDPRYLALLQLLRTSEEIWKASRDFFGSWGLGTSQFNVLNLLRLNPQGLSQTELSRDLIMHRSNITGLVDELEKKGLARREEVAGDRRAYRVVLTPAGSRLLAEILPEYFGRSVSVWGRLSSRRVAEITAGLQQVAVNVKAAAAERRAPRGPTRDGRGAGARGSKRS